MAIEVHFATDFINQQATLNWASERDTIETVRSQWSAEERARAEERCSAAAKSRVSWWAQGVEEGHALTGCSVTAAVPTTATSTAAAPPPATSAVAVGTMVQQVLEQWKSSMEEFKTNRAAAVAAAAAAAATATAAISATSPPSSTPTPTAPLDGAPANALLTTLAPYLTGMLAAAASTLPSNASPVSPAARDAFFFAVLCAANEQLLGGDATGSLIPQLTQWREEGSLGTLCAAAAAAAAASGSLCAGGGTTFFSAGCGSPLGGASTFCGGAGGGYGAGEEGEGAVFSQASQPFALSGAFLELMASQDSWGVAAGAGGAAAAALAQARRGQAARSARSAGGFSLASLEGDCGVGGTDEGEGVGEEASARLLHAGLLKDASFRELAAVSEGPEAPAEEGEEGAERATPLALQTAAAGEEGGAMVASLTHSFNAIAIGEPIAVAVDAQKQQQAPPASPKTRQAMLPPSLLRVFSPAAQPLGGYSARPFMSPLGANPPNSLFR
jgi:hypothetical protein